MYPLLVDPRAGSGDLLELFQRMGIPSKHEQMEYGDVSLIGRGPDERPVLIGVEIKKVPDLLQSFLSNRLVGHQLPGLVAAYELPWLLVEGPMISVNGELRVLKGNRADRPAGGEKVWTYREVQARLHSIRRTGVEVVTTLTRQDTVDWLAELWRWWNGKAWEEHESHLGIKQKPLQFSLADTYTVTRKMRVATDLAEGMGIKRARAAAEYFPSIGGMVNAAVDEWLKVEGVGDTLAQRIVYNVRREGA